MASWQSYSQTELDEQYSPSSRIESLTTYLDEYAERSRRARISLDHRADLPYGPDPAERLDLFPGPGTDCA